MHTYFRAIGLSNICDKQNIDRLIGDIMTLPTDKKIHVIKGNERFVEISKDYLDGIGVTIRGYYDNKGFFHLKEYFPYIKPMAISVQEKIYLNKIDNSESYNVLCDDMEFGVALIFYLQNMTDYMNLEDKSSYYIKDSNVFLSGLCSEGKILLPVIQNKKNKEKKRLKEKYLISEAKKGNQKAIDNLAIKQIDTYEMVNYRVKKEDVYSIVDSSFYPCGSEIGYYTIVGTIEKISLLKNKLTGENVYKLLVDCNNVFISVCINKEELLGEPHKGYRFKGNMWLQGKVDF